MEPFKRSKMFFYGRVCISNERKDISSHLPDGTKEKAYFDYDFWKNATGREFANCEDDVPFEMGFK